jgi:hypothetical protein
VAEQCSICGKSGLLIGGYKCEICERRICKSHSELHFASALIDKEIVHYLISSAPSSVMGQSVARITNNGEYTQGVNACPDCLKWLGSAKKNL